MSRAPARDERLPTNELPTLARLYVYLTEGCNLACRHCWLSPALDPEARRAVLSPDLFRRAIREAVPLGLGGVKLTGGEPLLHPDFLDFLEIVRAEGIGLALETNGLLLTPGIASEIARCGAADVAVSVDGADAGTHDAIRGVGGSFDAACAAVRALHAVGLGPQVIFTLLRSNAAQVPAVIRLAEGLGAASLKVNVLQPTARGKRLYERDEALSVEEVLALARRIDAELAPATPLRVVVDTPLAFRPLSRIAAGVGTCGILHILGVLPDGHYALCGIGEHVPDLVFGRVGADPLARIWAENQVLRDLREGMPSRLKGICGRCLLSARCLGDCVAQSYYRTHSLFEPSWLCEAADERGLFPVTRLKP